MLPDFQETAEFPLAFDDNPHWNENGHTFVANVLTEYLITNRVIE